MPTKTSLDCFETISFGVMPDLLDLINAHVASDDSVHTRSQFIRSCVIRYFMFHPQYKHIIQDMLTKDQK